MFGDVGHRGLAVPQTRWEVSSNKPQTTAIFLNVFYGFHIFSYKTPWDLNVSAVFLVIFVIFVSVGGIGEPQMAGS